MKNYFKEYKEFVKEQLEMSDEDLNGNWDGWERLYIAYRIDALNAKDGVEGKQ